MRSCERRRVRYCLGPALACFALAMAACEPSDSAAPAPAAPEPAAEERPVVLFLGTSLTAGYGLPAEEAFPALVQERIDAEGLDYRVVNAGVSGDTSAGGLRRIEWLLQLPIAVLVLELGANDMLRGLDVASLRRNLQAIIDRTRAVYPRMRLIVIGMRAAPNLGAGYVAAFGAVYPSLARANDAVLIPFALEGVAGNAPLNQPDGIHPTAEGHRRIAEMIWRTLGPVLQSDSAPQ
ncbi:MAG: arylesterase [Myxococcales bacterium]|nr:arylesterase [Myxococcales bacterium]